MTAAPQETGAGEVAHNAALAFNQANAAYRSGDPKAALSFCERALAVDPGLAIARVLEARCLFALGRLTEAKKAYEAALQSEPGNFSGARRSAPARRRDPATRGGGPT